MEHWTISLPSIGCIGFCFVDLEKTCQDVPLDIRGVSGLWDTGTIAFGHSVPTQSKWEMNCIVGRNSDSFLSGSGVDCCRPVGVANHNLQLSLVWGMRTSNQRPQFSVWKGLIPPLSEVLPQMEDSIGLFHEWVKKIKRKDQEGRAGRKGRLAIYLGIFVILTSGHKLAGDQKQKKQDCEYKRLKWFSSAWWGESLCHPRGRWSSVLGISNLEQAPEAEPGHRRDYISQLIWKTPRYAPGEREPWASLPMLLPQWPKPG